MYKQKMVTLKCLRDSTTGKSICIPKPRNREEAKIRRQIRSSARKSARNVLAMGRLIASTGGKA